MPIAHASFAPDDFPFTLDVHNEATDELIWSAEVTGAGALTIPACDAKARVTFTSRHGSRTVLNSDGTCADEDDEGDEKYTLIAGPPIDAQEYALVHRLTWEAWMGDLDRRGLPRPVVFPGSVESTCSGCGVRVGIGPRQQQWIASSPGEDTRVACPLCASLMAGEADEMTVIALDNQNLPDTP